MAQLERRQVQKRKIANSPELEASVLFKTPTKHDQVMQQQQSFAMVQTLLLSSVATIASLRKLFPYECFEKRNYTDVRDDALRTYCSRSDITSFQSDGPGELWHRPETVRNPWAVNVLARGKSSGADKLLDWLDVVLKGVLQKDLSGVQFSIFADVANPSNVLESYTFSFEYSKRISGGEHQLIGLALSGPRGKPVSMTSARSGLEKLVGRLIQIDVTLPDLPDTRFLTCHLFHRSKSSLSLLPRGFRQCQDTTIYVPDDEFWHANNVDLGSMDSGFHAVGLQLIHVAPVEDTQPDSEGTTVIPQRMKHNKLLSRFQGLKVQPIQPAISKIDTHLRSERPSGSDQYPIEVDEGQHFFCEDSVERTEKLTGDAPVSWGRLIDGDLTMTQEQNIDSNSRKLLECLRLLPGKRLEIDTKRDEILRTRVEILGDKVTNEMCCECEYNVEEGNTMLCNCCKKRQHCHCYGFVSRVPIGEEQHFCYTCLFSDTDQSRLKRLKRLAQFRRALWISYDQGYPGTQAAFAKMLSYDARTTAQIIQQMKDEGYLTIDTRSRLVLVDSAEQDKIRHHDYCNPMTLVKLYYELRSQEESESPSQSNPDPRYSLRKRSRRS